MIRQLASFTLTTERLRIRPVEKIDLESIYHIHSDHQVNQYLPYQTWRTWDDARIWYARVLMRRRQELAQQFVIVRNEDSTLIGSCIVFIHEFDSDNLELGYVLGRAHWGQGYMHEALNDFVPTIAGALQLEKMYAIIDTRNRASRKLIRKLGFTETHHESDQQDDKKVELAHYRRDFNSD